MPNQKRNVRRWFISVIMLASLLFAGYAAAKDKDRPSQRRGEEKVETIFDDQAGEFEEPTYTVPADIEAKIKAIPKMPSDIKKYLKEKYSMKGDDVVSASLKQTQNGPQGTIVIHGRHGDIRPKVITEGTKEERIRGMARALIQEEASFFRVHNFDELREVGLRNDDLGYTSIRYQRYVGDLPLEDADIHIEFGPKEDITWVSFKSIPVSSELYHAVAKTTIGKGKIFRIIAQDLKMLEGGTGIGNVGISSGQKVAIPDPPYVIWKVRAGTALIGWDYKIDAFSGEILEKQDARRF